MFVLIPGSNSSLLDSRATEGVLFALSCHMAKERAVAVDLTERLDIYVEALADIAVVCRLAEQESSPVEQVKYLTKIQSVVRVAAEELSGGEV